MNYLVPGSDLTLQVGHPSSGGVPDSISNWETEILTYSRTHHKYL